MVKNRSKRATDLLDLMEATRFFGEDHPALFESLGNEAGALLTAHQPRLGEANLSAEQEGCTHHVSQKSSRRTAAQNPRA